MKKFKVILLLIVLSLFLLFPKISRAQDFDKFVTIVNPVRISSYSKNPELSLASEYAVIKKNNLPATWLITYDALNNKKILSVFKDMNKGQEFGIFLEVTKQFADDSGVKYNNSGFWQHANSVFLSGYEQQDRKKLIDAVFKKFKIIFGYYPKSVGSWWTDAYSLSYMHDKYGVQVNLVCSDQYSTDGYQIWGQPWEVAYYPGKFYSSVPASDNSSKIGVVNIQWAPRDPLNGYENSLYSTQDYLVAPIKQDISYFRKLVNVYLSMGGKDGFSQVTVGLEADLDPIGYREEFAKQMDYIQRLSLNGVVIARMSDFSDWYRKRFPDLSPSYQISVQDLIGGKTQSFWYGNGNYRLFYEKDNGLNQIQIKDLRIYNKNLSDPYFNSPNSQFTLSENIPAVIDSVSNSNDIWTLPGDSEIIPEGAGIRIKGKNLDAPDFLLRSQLVNLNRNQDEIKISFIDSQVPPDGIEVKDFSSEALHFFKQKLAVFYLLTGQGWSYLKKVYYLIPQGEIYALLYLKSQYKGLVMVYDGECLQCSWHSQYKPPAFSNLRGYISRYSGMPVIYNKSVFDSKTQSEAKKEFNKLHARYVYLVKLENYREKLPFSPGDLGVERIFSNANAEIWRVK